MIYLPNKIRISIMFANFHTALGNVPQTFCGLKSEKSSSRKLTVLFQPRMDVRSLLFSFSFTKFPIIQDPSCPIGNRHRPANRHRITMATALGAASRGSPQLHTEMAPGSETRRARDRADGVSVPCSAISTMTGLDRSRIRDDDSCGRGSLTASTTRGLWLRMRRQVGSSSCATRSSSSALRSLDIRDSLRFQLGIRLLLT